MDTRSTVEIMEVAPRDGFQSISDPLPTDEKIGIVEDLIAAGCPRMEIGSFVSPRAVPQMGDMKEIAAHFRDRDGVRLAVLIPNVKGAELAQASGMREIVYVFSASEAHNRNNVRQSVAESIAGLEAVAGALDEAVRVRVDIATCFDCPFDGAVPEEDVLHAVRETVRILPGCEIALCDTTGRANPVGVERRFRAAMAEVQGSGVGWAFHGHDTFGMGVANALFAHRAGVRVFDGSAAGLGGCPFAPGATGNTATEDLVFTFEEADIATGIDMGRLLKAADRIAALPEGKTGGHLRIVPRDRAVA